jgi:hypothetical protein
MKTEDLIARYLDSLPEARRADMRRLHGAILGLNPGCRLWFSDGKDASGKVVSNPSIGYGAFARPYAGGATREMFQAGISANSTGLSVYIMGLDDRKYLPSTYGARIGKAAVTGYCIKFKALDDVDVDVLLAAVRDGIAQTSA